MKLNINQYGFTKANIESDDIDLLALLVAAACGVDPAAMAVENLTFQYWISQCLKYNDGKYIVVNDHVIPFI